MNTNDPLPDSGAVIPQGWPEMPDTVLKMPLAVERWQTVCRLMDEMQVLSTVDLVTLEGYCVNYALWRSALQRIQNPRMDRKATEFTNYQKLADRNMKFEKTLGFTIQTRQYHKRHRDAAEKETPIADIISRLGMVG